MAINKNSTGYTFTFAIVMVVVVGTALAFTAMSLKDKQAANAADKKMMDILGAIRVDADRSNASALFEQYVVERIAIDLNGKELDRRSGALNVKDKQDPFGIDVQKDYRGSVKAAAKANKDDIAALKASLAGSQDLKFPLYRCTAPDGKNVFVVPVVGSGLWGPIWGYVALESDMKTIYGAKFDHKTETPGLGAEIKEALFTEKWPGKQLNVSGPVVFEVVKGGSPTTTYQVDGITGGTITSKGVGEMVNRTMAIYGSYFKSQTQANAQR
jgi:Na+-transporting NADH:ubiquinone oxidoreductase subunit C